MKACNPHQQACWELYTALLKICPLLSLAAHLSLQRAETTQRSPPMTQTAHRPATASLSLYQIIVLITQRNHLTYTYRGVTM